MKTTKVSTWLPLFSGFYETIWNGDSQEECELENINELRAEIGLPKVDWDDVEWDTDSYEKAVVEGVTDYVCEELIKMKLIKAYRLEKLSSPREYNFYTDAIHVQMTVTESNKRMIEGYLTLHRPAFEAYLKERYTSRSGFISSYENYIEAWMDDFEETITHEHKLGAVFEFILRHEDQVREIDIYEHLRGNGLEMQAANYSELVPKVAL